jgi:hypothetical protein
MAYFKFFHAVLKKKGPRRRGRLMAKIRACGRIAFSILMAG